MSPSTPPPQRIGKYEIEQFLGGGMSAVYRARDTLIGRQVAIKVLKETYSPEDPTAQRFILEAKIAGNLNHENVIRTYDFGFDPEGRPYMVLEYLEGEDLAQAIKGGRSGDLRNRARIAWELAGALEYIHPRNVVHRDLKPANIIMSGGAQGTVKLMDFGISRTENVSITQTGMTMGTPGYMAPEQIRGETVTKAADIYSYGVVLWELFTGQRGFAADTLERVFYMALNEPLDIERLRAAGVPDELAQQICKCASKEVWKRPADLTAIREELARLMDPSRAGPATAPSPALAETVAMVPSTAIGSHSTPRPVTATTPTPAVPPPPVTPTPDTSRGEGGSDSTVKYVAAGVGLVAVAGIGLWLAGIIGGGGTKVGPGVDKRGTAAVTQLAEEISTSTGAMVLVPELVFQFGQNRERVNLPAYYIDKTEVSNRAYADFLRTTGGSAPPGFGEASPDLPVVNISFDEAQAFAAWAGKALPTSKQWEKAARGIDGRTFPWGEEPDALRANVGKGPKGSLVPVSQFPDGASPFRALQMVGNAWEWVDETGVPKPEILASLTKLMKPPPTAGDRWVEIRGGSFAESLDAKALWDKTVMHTRFRNGAIGFRCVKSASQ